MDFTSTTLIKVLESISYRSTNSALITNIALSVVKNKSTPLQLALGFCLVIQKRQ